MRLLYLTADPGVPVRGHKGASVHVREIVGALRAAGADVAVASPRIAPEGDVLDPTIELHPISPVLPKSLPSPTELRAAMATQAEQVIELAAELGVDAICERYSLFSDAGVKAADALDLPHVLEVNAPLRDEAVRFRSLPHAQLAGEIEAHVYAATRRIFVVSNRLAKLVQDQGVESAKIEVAANGVSEPPFAPRPKDAARPFTVGFAGGAKAWHGVELLVSAFRTVLARGIDARLEIVAAGPLDGTLDAVELPEGRLTRCGPLSHAETLRRMTSWDVGVAPFLPVPDFYFSPLKILEYMAAGVCPVASELGDIAALLGGGERGVLVRAGEGDALSESLVALARDRERAWRLGARARAHVLANCRWEDNADRVLAVLTGASQVVAA